MAELVFYYGAMSCSKTANALMTRFQYLDKGLGVWLIKPSTDNRDDIIYEDGHVTNIIKSRVGIFAEADVIYLTESFYEKLKVRCCEGKRTDLIIVDEAQFLSEEQVDELKDITETMDISVYCYGLRTDFRTKLFPGSKRLFEIGKVVELESVCSCGKPAIINARFDKTGRLMTHGAQVDIGGDEKYKALCYSCWKELTKKDV